MGSGFVKRDEVVDCKSFAMYAHQNAGVPYPNGKEIAGLCSYLKQFRERYPGADWETLCKIVDWVVNNKQKYWSPQQLVANGHKKAWLRGYLPELDYTLTDLDVDVRVERILSSEELDDDWARRFSLAQTPQEKEAVLSLFEQEFGK